MQRKTGLCSTPRSGIGYRSKRWQRDRHLSHLHHVVRFKSDRAWPAPVWGRFPAVAYSQAALAEIRPKLASAALAGFEFLGPD
jgi:diadenosine tetraphosphate (Ap4A) HIT family hydrolase